MPRNSFALCRYSAPTEPRTFLSEEELRIFQTSRLKSAKHECHRGLFLFSRFTEICYKDMRYLTCEQIIQGIPLSTVSKMLGHKQITTTQIYAQTTPIMIEDAIDRVESRLDGKFAA